MKIAVVTPYYRETAEQLARCHQSIKNQTVPTDHFFVSDGFPNPIVDTWDCVHIKVPNHADYGDTPRLIGASSAASLRYDAILLLDADNWFEPEHVQTLLDVQAREQADVVTCSRMLIRSDLTLMGECIESDGKRFNDTNCYLVMKHAFPLFRAWGFKDPSLGIVGDRVFWNALKTLPLRIAHSPKPTVNYVTTFAFHYALRGETPPPGSKDIVRMPDGSFKMMSWEQAKAYQQSLKDDAAAQAAARLSSQGGTASV